MQLPEDDPKPLPDFDAGLVARLYKEGGLKKVDQVMDMFRQNTVLYIETLQGKSAPASAEEKGGLKFWSKTENLPRPLEERLAEEKEALGRLKQQAVRAGANAMGMLCEDLLAGLEKNRKPLQPAELSALEQAVTRARRFLEEERKKL